MQRFQLTLTMAVCAMLASGQTKVDLKSQSKGADFSGQATKPFETGAVLPSTCNVGQMFFNTAAPNGRNMFGCVSANIWLEQTGTGGAPSIQIGGTTVGARGVINFIQGPGVTQAISDTGMSIAIQSSVDTATVQTRTSDQSGSALLCTSTTASASTHVCGLSPALTIYTVGMVVRWKPDVDGSGGPTTLNLDALGDVPVKMADGITNPSVGDIRGGGMQQVWYDGASFRLLDRNVTPGVLGETRPSCTAAARGRLWFVANSIGTADSFSLCSRDAAGAFAWRAF